MEIKCPECGAVHKVSPAHARRWKSFVCRECIKRKRQQARQVQCPECLAWRECKPSVVKRMKSLICAACIAKKQQAAWVETTCPKCGRTRKIQPYELAKKERRGLKHTGYCRSCSRVYDLTIPDTWDAGYVVGVTLGDGHIFKAAAPQGTIFMVVLSVTSEAFARKYREIFSRLRGGPVWLSRKERHMKANPKIGMPECDIVEWRAGATDRGWYERLWPLKKGRDFSMIRGMSLDFKAGFIQGMVDSEGNLTGSGSRVANKDLSLLGVVVDCARELGYFASIQGPYEHSRGVAYAYIGKWLVKTQ